MPLFLIFLDENSLCLKKMKWEPWIEAQSQPATAVLLIIGTLTIAVKSILISTMRVIMHNSLLHHIAVCQASTTRSSWLRRSTIGEVILEVIELRALFRNQRESTRMRVLITEYSPHSLNKSRLHSSRISHLRLVCSLSSSQSRRLCCKISENNHRRSLYFVLQAHLIRPRRWKEMRSR